MTIFKVRNQRHFSCFISSKNSWQISPRNSQLYKGTHEEREFDRNHSDCLPRSVKRNKKRFSIVLFHLVRTFLFWFWQTSKLFLAIEILCANPNSVLNVDYPPSVVYFKSGIFLVRAARQKCTPFVSQRILCKLCDFSDRTSVSLGKSSDPDLGEVFVMPRHQYSTPSQVPPDISRIQRSRTLWLCVINQYDFIVPTCRLSSTINRCNLFSNFADSTSITSLSTRYFVPSLYTLDNLESMTRCTFCHSIQLTMVSKIRD